MTQADMRVHWDRRWAGTEAEQVSWYQSRATTSLRLITEHCPPSEPVVDVGAGRSTLAKSLIERGYRDVTVLDVSERALADTTDTTRGGPHRVVGDVLSWQAGRRYGAWHDRALFHFLTEPDEQSHYCNIAAATIRPGGCLVLATFAPDGPNSCSCLPVHRWDAPRLSTFRPQVHRGPQRDREPCDTSRAAAAVHLPGPPT